MWGKLAIGAGIVAGVAIATDVLLDHGPDSRSASKPPLDGLPDFRLTPPADVARGLEGAEQRAVADDRAWLAAGNAPSSHASFRQDVIDRVGTPPTGAAQAADMARMHAVQDSRTHEGVSAARFYALDGLDAVWVRELAHYARTEGPSKALQAARLIAAARRRDHDIDGTAKSHFARARPYATDPTIHPAVVSPGTNPSFPSGHTSSAFAVARVFSYLEPARAKQFEQAAEEVAWSRVYGGVHYPTDVIAGAYTGTRAADEAIAEQRGAGALGS